MPLIVDCYNVLHVVMPPSLAGLDEGKLCHLLGTHPWTRQFGRIVVVADGMPKPGRAASSPVPNVSLRFSGRGRSADSVIMHLIDGESAPRSLTVVSSDREIQRHARSRRAAVMESATLIREIAKPSARRVGAGDDGRPTMEEPLPGAMVEAWIKRLGVDPQALGDRVTPREVIAKGKAEAARRESEAKSRAREKTNESKPRYRRLRHERPGSVERDANKPLPDGPIDLGLTEADYAALSNRALDRTDKQPESARTDEASSRGAASTEKLDSRRDEVASGERGPSKAKPLSDVERWMRELGVSEADEFEPVDESLLPKSQNRQSPRASKEKEESKPRTGKGSHVSRPPPREKGTREEKLRLTSDGDTEAWLKLFGFKPDGEEAKK